MAVKLLFFNETTVDVSQYEENIINIIEATYKYESLEGEYKCNYIFVDNEKIKELNYMYRGKDYATDVLSFDFEADMLLGGAKNLGDIFISVEKMIEQAQMYGHSVEREMSFLAVHGFLHLLGYDHILEDEAKIMFAKQEAILNDKNIRR